MKLAPDDFPLASDVAQTFYGIRPPRPDDALRAWTNAFNLARDDIEREGVHTHFARVKLHAGQFDEARLHLNSVTNEMYAELKRRLTRSLGEEEAKAKDTNAPPTEAVETMIRAEFASPEVVGRRTQRAPLLHFGATWNLERGFAAPTRPPSDEPNLSPN